MRRRARALTGFRRRRRLELRLRLRGFTATGFRRRVRRRAVLFRLRLLFAIFTILVLYLMIVLTLALLRLLRRGVARVRLRRRELVRLLRTFSSRPFLSRARPASEFRFRLRAIGFFLRGFAPIKARCGFRFFGRYLSDFPLSLRTVSPAREGE